MAKSEYVPTIGLEIHAELKTRTKMFCNSKNDPDENRPNVNICPICMAHPGTLPTINKETVRHVLLVGTAIGGKLADYTEFDRKNYFYPDIPKGYQISQYKYPLVSGGALNGVDITRVHLEEDTARSIHGGGDRSIIDFNRAGIPLMEMVTEPVIHSAEDAVSFAKELQILLRTIGVGEANMEKGEMRVEANISVGKAGERGTKVEVKNLNSFRSIERAILCEFERQVDLVEKGERVVQETRGWDENKETTFSQRLKEDSHDYRYFPDPDLPKLFLSELPEFDKGTILKNLPELPWQRRGRYKRYGIKDESIEMYLRDVRDGDEEFMAEGQLRVRGIGSFFEECLNFCGDEKELVILVSNFLTSDIPGIIKKIISEEKKSLSNIDFPKAKDFVELVKMFKNKEISSRSAKDILEEIIRLGGSPKEIAENKGLLQKSDKAFLREVVKKIIELNPEPVVQYRAGKIASIQFLVGLAMKETKGSGNPSVMKVLLEEELK